MQSVSSRTRCLIFLLALTVGCNSKSTSKTASSENGEITSASEGSSGRKSKLPIKQGVKTLEGNWIVVVTNQKTDNYAWLIKFSKSPDGKFVGEFLQATRDPKDQGKPDFVATDVDGDSIRLSFKGANGPFDFVGSFQQGFIRGTIRPSPKEILMARLLPTDETTLDRFNATGLPPATDIYETMLKTKEVKLEDLLSAAKENRTSPVTQDMFATLITGHLQARDEATVKDLIDAYISSASIWGDRWCARAEVTVAMNLINGRKYTQLAFPHLDAAEQKMGDEKDLAAELFASLRDAANTNLRIQEINSPSSSDEIKQAAFADLTNLLKKQRYNSEILFALAMEAERTGQVDVAMDYYSEVVALPLLEATVIRARAGQPPDTPTPSESLKKLWTKKNGSENEEGYAQYVDTVYHQKIGELLAEIQSMDPATPAAEPGNRTTLIELFTGMQCPPCVSADLALAAIGKTYPTSQVIIIRHHQHIPLPDGLVNQESEERSAFYETGSTPTVTLDGIILDGRFYAGAIQASPNAYSVFRKVIDQRLTEKTEVALEMSAKVVAGQLQVSVAATGIPDEMLPSCRLRMAIVENEVRASAPNGIRDHEYVVREMLGGAKGIPPKKGELKYSITIPMADIQQHVIDYIKQFEAGKRLEFPKELKPPIQGPLSLVAWVQNDKAPPNTNLKFVLQSSMIPITSDQEQVPETSPAATEHPTATAEKKTATPAEKPEAGGDEAGGDKASAPTPEPPALPEPLAPTAPLAPPKLPEPLATPEPPARPEPPVQPIALAPPKPIVPLVPPQPPAPPQPPVPPQPPAPPKPLAIPEPPALPE